MRHLFTNNSTSNSTNSNNDDPNLYRPAFIVLNFIMAVLTIFAIIHVVICDYLEPQERRQRNRSEVLRADPPFDDVEGGGDYHELRENSELEGVEGEINHQVIFEPANNLIFSQIDGSSNYDDEQPGLLTPDIDVDRIQKVSL